MKSGNVIAGVIAAAVIAAVGSSGQAAVLTYLPGSNTGTLTVTTNPPLQTASAPVGSPYGAPVITPIASGWKLTFSPTASFFAAANNGNLTQTETTVMEGQLSFDVSFSSAVKLTTTIAEDGIFSKIGSAANSTFSISGGGTVTPIAPGPLEPAIINGNLGSSAVFNSITGGWTASAQITGFNNSYTNYHISVDNILSAEAFASSSFASAIIAKKDFTIFLTTDGSNGSGQPPTPEPASLGLLSLGGLALLRRRRR